MFCGETSGIQDIFSSVSLAGAPVYYVLFRLAGPWSSLAGVVVLLCLEPWGYSRAAVVLGSATPYIASSRSMHHGARERRQLRACVARWVLLLAGEPLLEAGSSARRSGSLVAVTSLGH